MLGLRWEKPERTYGDLESFTISYQKEMDEERFSVIVPPVPCPVWNYTFCYTIKHLKPEVKYVMSVCFNILKLILRQHTHNVLNVKYY